MDYLRIQGKLHPHGLFGKPATLHFEQCSKAYCLCCRQGAGECLQSAARCLHLLACWPPGADSSLRTAPAAEYADQKLFVPLTLDPPKDRLSEWQQLGRRHPGLEACILAANPSWQAELIPAK